MSVEPEVKLAELEDQIEKEDAGKEVVLARYEGEEDYPSWKLPVIGDKTGLVIKVTALLLLISYTIAALIIDFERAKPVMWTWVFVFGVLAIKYGSRIPAVGAAMSNIQSGINGMTKAQTNVGLLVILILMLASAFISAREDLSRLTSLGGLVVLVLVSYLFSWKRSQINWRPVIWGLALQWVFALFILSPNFQFGRDVFSFFARQFDALTVYTFAGTSFVFGHLVENFDRVTGLTIDYNATPPVGVVTHALESNAQFAVFAFNILSIIVVFSSIVSLLFYLNLLQPLTYATGRVMSYTMGTSAPESLSAAGNIFLGQTESPLMIRPYLKYMTNSEIHAVMTGGFATIAGGVLAAFIGFGVPAEQLLAASVMSAPAALAISKLVYPETIKVDDSHVQDITLDETATNAIEAVSNGAGASISLIANIVVNLISFLAFLDFFNTGTSWFFAKVDVEQDFEGVLSYLFYPVAILIGIPAEDALEGGKLMGLKVFTNEFVAFLSLQFDGQIDPSSRSYLILTYALCGFSNFSSIGIQLGALGIMAPGKKASMAKMGLSAMICGNIACFMTACIAGVIA